jgi:hypothetical protein
MNYEIGDKIETSPSVWVEIKSIGEYVAQVYQLDENKERIKKFRGEGLLEGKLTIKEKNLISL